MTPDTVVNAIVAALSAGVAKGGTDAAKEAVGDAYEGLKCLIKKRFGNQSEAAIAIDKLEAAPDSEGRRQTLGEELQSVNADADPELVSATHELIALIRKLPQGEANIQLARGRGIAQADHGSTAKVNFYSRSGKDD
jgi:hypothetical protein